MAGKDFPLSITLRAIDQATAEIRKVNREVAKAGKKIAQVGKSISTHVTLPIVAMGAAGALAFREFEAGMSNVGTLIDTTKESLDAMGRTVLEIGRRTPVAVSDLTSALYDIRSAGVGVDQQFTVLEQSARLATAGLGTTKQAVDLVTSSINAFQLEGEGAARIYDVVFKTVKNGKTTIDGLAQGFGAVAGTVAATGIQIDEYLASVAALTTTGLPAAQAHTQLRAVITGLQRPTEKTRAVFRKLGAKDLNDLIEKSGGLVPALERVSSALKGNQSRMLALFGSTEALNAVLGLTGAQNDEYTATLDDMRNGANAVDAAFSKQNKTMQASMQRTKNALTSAAVALGRVLAPALEKVAKVLQRVADWFDGLDDSTKEWVVTIAAVVAAIGPAIVIIGSLVRAIAMVRTAIAVLSVVMRANPIIAAIGLIATAAYLIIENWEPIKAFFKKLWDGIVGVFEWAWGKIKWVVDKIIAAAKKALGAVKKVKGWADRLGLTGPTAQLTAALEDRQAQLEAQKEAAESRRETGGFLSEKFLSETITGKSTARVEVDFKNMPKGARATIDPSSTADVDVTTGMQLVAP